MKIPRFGVLQVPNDGFGLEWNRDRLVAAELILKKLKNCESWLTKSGMKVNEQKTGLCLFHNNDTAPIIINFYGADIRSTPNINVLGVIFDQKLQWSDHVAQSILKSNRALNAIRLLKRHFTTKELLQLLTSNYYSVLYYNSEIWHLHSLKSSLKQKLMSSSARALKACLKFYTNDLSFVRIHEMCNRATPEKFLLYKYAISLFKLMNTSTHSLEWASLNFNIVLTSRQTNFIALKGNKRKAGLNALANRVFILNNRIPLVWFNMTINTFKVHCKSEFLM